MSTASHPPPSNALWGQLLRKNTVAPPAAAPLPPTAPLDKTGTSMRILLHDTQANFEKFSTRVDTLTSGIDEAKREIVVVKDLFQGAQESLTTDIVDLVNRSQTQIQKSMGDPAQATVLELFRKDVDTRLGGLSKRLDDMQSFNQTQSQALQNVSQTLQSLQDQQGKILSALLPLLPLLQAVPVHINSARSSINETMLKVSLESSRSHRTPPQIWPQPPQVIYKRRFPVDPPSSPLLARKKPKLDEEHIESDRVTLAPNSMSGDYLNGHPSPKTASRRPSFPNKGPYVSLSGPGHPPAPRQTRRTPSLPKPTAPRRPLGDLPVPLQNRDFRDVPYLRSPASVKDLFTLPTNRNPLIPSSRLIPQPDTGTPRTPPPLDSRLPPPVTPQRAAVPASAAASSPSPIVPSNPIASSDPLPIYLALPVVQPAAKGTDTKPTTSLDKPPAHPLRSETAAQIVPSAVAVSLPAKVTMVRGRRSPFRDGRRFIPLDDDDSDSEDDD